MTQMTDTTNAQQAVRIDSHQHFWHYTDEDFGWISDAMANIRRDFLPGDLKPLIDESSIQKVVAVQARQSLEETNWLLSLADENDWIAGVVGWVPLISPQVEADLERLADEPKLKGIRHVLQGEPDTYMLRDDFNAGVALLQKYSLVYDVLVVERQLDFAIQFVDRHPQQRFVLDHIAKPLIAAQELEPWRTQIRELAKRPNVTCKLSGMVTEADFKTWTTADLRPYIETVLEAFGPRRLMFGSDWPVCQVACTYQNWVKVIEAFLSQLTQDEQAWIFGRTAKEAYQLI